MDRRLHDTVSGTIDELAEHLKDISRQIYEHPELPFEERFAAGLLSGEAEKAGFEVERGTAGLETAFVARKRGRADRPSVAFLAEYDALPSIGHGCGHNIIGTSALGAALALAPVMEHLEGTIVLVGTPAEEGGGGKALMADASVFDGVDAAMLVHPSTRTFVTRGSLASAGFTLKFHGRPSHAAGAPEQGINALDALIQTYNSINALRQHFPLDTRVHGIITHGGEAPNIVPHYAEGRFLVRAREIETQEQMIEMFRECALSAARAMKATVEIEENKVRYDPLVTNPTLARVFRDHLLAAGWAEMEPTGSGGSTDMGNVSQLVPTIHPMMSLASGDDAPTGHSEEFARATMTPEGHRCLLDAARCMALTGLDLLLDPGLIDEAWRAFRGETG